MDSTITLIIVFAIGWFLGSRIQWFLDQITFKQILNDLGVTTRQLTELIERADAPEEINTHVDGVGLTPLEITLEQHQGVIYAYRKDTKQFLGQGTDRQGLIDSIAKRMTDVRLIIDQTDGADLLQKRNG